MRIISQQIACAECGQLHQFQSVSVGKTACCVRCGAVLYRQRSHMEEISLALTISGLLLYILSNIFPLLGLRAQNVEYELHLLGASLAFWEQDYQIIAILVVLNIIVFPLLELFALLVVLLTIRFAWKPRVAIVLYRWMRELKPWGMLEVFMLGVLVSVVKLGSMATLIIGPAFWSFVGLVVVMAAATATLDPFTIWQRLDALKQQVQPSW